MPFTVGTSVAGALDNRSGAVQAAAAVLLWAGWAVTVLGLLIPRPAGLVALRVGAIAAAAMTAWSADSGEDWTVAGGHAVVLVALALASRTGEWMVNGTSYGYERRYLLRAPGAVLAGPLLVATAGVPVAIAAGPLLLAAEQWVVGAIALVAGTVVALVLARALYSMTIRWAVLVPAGLVLKDHLALLDPVLFRRTDIEVLHPAPADSDALDCTVDAPGLALELRLRTTQHIDRMRPVRRGSEPFEVEHLLFTPTRPSALLADAASRRVRVAGSQA